MIYAVSRDRLWAVTDDGEVCEIVNLFDCDGEETRDPEQAISAVARLPGNRWASILLTEYEAVTVH